MIVTAVTGVFMDKLVIFDLDGTLVKGQSQRLLLNYLLRKRLVGRLPYLRILWWFALRKAGISQQPLKIMEYAFSILQNWKTETFDELIEEFFNESLVSSIFNDGKELVRGHDDGKSNLILVSNAIEPIVKRAAVHLGIGTSIGTRLETQCGRLTGKIDGGPLFGHNKTISINDHVARHNLTLEGSWAYCDELSDLPVMEMVSNPVAVNPSTSLRKVATNRNWQILDFKK